MLTTTNLRLSTHEIIKLAEDIIARSNAHSNDGNPAISGPARNIIYWAQRLVDESQNSSHHQIDDADKVREVYVTTLEGVRLLLARMAIDGTAPVHLSDLMGVHKLLLGMGSYFKG